MNLPQLHLLTLWACILSAVYRPALKDFQSGGVSTLLSNGLGANYIVWFALLVGSRILLTEKIQLNRLRDFIILSGVLILMCMPSASLAWFAASLVALSLLKKSSSSFAPLLLFAACIREPITSISLKIFAGNILGLDAQLTNIALTAMGFKAILQSNILITENGNHLLILTGCSVFTNLSYVSLLWLSIYVSNHVTISRLSLLCLSGLITLTLCSNALRLALMTTSEQAYFYYHDGVGSQLFEWGLMGLCLVIIILSCRYETPEKNVSHNVVA